jgi:hypothetical protein
MQKSELKTQTPNNSLKQDDLNNNMTLKLNNESNLSKTYPIHKTPLCLQLLNTGDSKRAQIGSK